MRGEPIGYSHTDPRSSSLQSTASAVSIQRFLGRMFLVSNGTRRSSGQVLGLGGHSPSRGCARCGGVPLRAPRGDDETTGRR
jgi:hypothetical protein